MALGQWHSFSIRARTARHAATKSVPAEKLLPIYRSRVDRLLSGPHSGRTRRLLTFLHDMELHDGRALVEHIRDDGWPHTDREVRADALSLINIRVTHLRKRAGLPPFDDSLPGASPNVFIVLREMLVGGGRNG